MPGAGLIIVGRYYLSLVPLGVFLACLFVVAWSRLILDPIGVKFILGAIATVYLISSGACLTGTWSRADKMPQRLMYTSVFIALSISILSVGFIYKPVCLGIQVYFVPSMSMYPTLKPGQFILLDTWAYKNHEPQINDIVVFHHKSENQDLVKRIVDWPDGVTRKDEQWFLMGDNRKYSRDSRSFGGIEQHQIVGQVKLMLLGIGNNDRLSDNRYLQPVH